MLAPRSKKAPKMFDSNEDDIAEFLDIYEQCAEDAQLPVTDCVKVMFWYLDRSQRLTFEAFEGCTNGDWDTLKAAIKEAFRGAFQTKKCTCLTLDSFIHVAATKVITTDIELWVYHCDFQGIAAYLINDKQLSEKDAARYYWFRFHPAAQEQLERRLGIVKPDHPQEDPFPIADIYKAGCYIFNTNTFNHTPLLSVPSPESSVLRSQGVEEPSHVVKRTVHLPKDEPEDITELLTWLQGFKIDDEAYMARYFQILAKDPGCRHMLQPPTAYTPVVSAVPTMPLQHLGVPQPIMPQTCVFCHGLGHAPRDCPIGQEYVWIGKVIFERGFYRWPNGVRIQGHPQGLKATVDQILQSQAATPVVQQGTAAYYRVDPITNEEGAGEISERNEEATRGLYPAIVSPATAPAKSSSAPSHTSPEPGKKAAQF